MTQAVNPLQPGRPRRISLALKPRAIAILLGATVALVRIVLARPVSFCGTPDACFYLGMAQSLASGHGFRARFLYDLQQVHPTLPNTGIEYWRPGVSILLLLVRPFGEVTLHNSIVLTTMVGVAFASAAWHIAAQTYLDRRMALGSFALCLLSTPAWIGSVTPDSGLYYGAAVGWFLALFTVRRQGLLQDCLALACAGLAYLIRNDGALLLVPLLAVLWRRRRARQASWFPDREGASMAYGLAMVAGFLLALAPMHLLYRYVLGTAFPVGLARVLFFNDLSDFGRYRDPATLHTLLGHGVGHLVLLRVETLMTVVYRVAVLMIGYSSLVFLPGLLLPRETGVAETEGAFPAQLLPEHTGPLSFALITLFAYTMVLPAIGGFSALRTAIGLIPFASVLVIAAIVRVARTLKLAVWVTVAVIASNAVAGVIELRRDLPAGEQIGAADREEAKELAALGGDPAHAVVLTNDPVQFSVTTGYATVALPNNGLAAIVQAAHDLHATHVILDSDHLPATPAELARHLQFSRSAELGREHSLILELSQTPPTP